MDLSAYKNVVDFKNICRTCMNNQNLRRKIRDENVNVENNSIPVLELVNLVYEVKLHKGFPDEICSACIEQLRSFYKLKLQIEKSESVLKKHLGPRSDANPAPSPLAPSNTNPTGCPLAPADAVVESETLKPYRQCSPLDLTVNEADIDLGPLKIDSDSSSNVERATSGTSEKRKRKKDEAAPRDDVAFDPAVCSTCNKSFKSKYILNVHLKRHKFRGQFLCTLCGKGFNSQGCLNRHTKVHTGEKNYRCDVCQKRFPSSNNLNIHARTHTGVKPYLCNMCGKSFSNRTGLNFHIRTHSKERPYACDVCNKSFGAQSHLDWHRMIHTGERPFPCEQCDKAFIKKCDLRRHRSVHTGEKPYPCAHCDKQFSTKVHLQYHTMVHTDERPHKCPVCSKGFIRRYYLRDHMVKRHGTLEGTNLVEKS